MEHQAIGQTTQHRAFTRLEVTGQGGHEVAGAYHLDKLSIRMILVQNGFVVNSIDGDALVPGSPFGRVQTSTGGQPMLEMESAILQIPTPRPAGAFGFKFPETHQ